MNGSVSVRNAARDLCWADGAQLTTRAIWLWRTPEGFHYEAQWPRSSGDEEVCITAFEYSLSGDAIGTFPHLGKVRYEDGGIAITEVSIVERVPANSDTP